MFGSVRGMNSLKFILVPTLLLVFVNVAKSGPSVIIVGAGPAGLAASAKLLESGVTNLTILEAEDRIGGRVNSVKFGDAFVDVGAEFCHGQKNNVVYEMVKDLDVLTYSPSIEEVQLRYSNGSHIGGQLQADWSKFLFVDSGLVVKSDADDEDESSDAPVVSFGDALIKRFNDTLLKKYENDQESLKILQQAMRTLEFFTISNEGAFTWSEVTATSGFEDSEGDQHITWSGHGYKTILEVLLKGFPDPKQRLPIDDKIHLNKKVSKITWDFPEPGVTVECSDKTIYNADHVIVTPSIGVLKHDHTNLFSPQLPEAKQEAIKDIGFGGVMKIILHFPNKWWDDELGSSFFVWSEEDLKEIENEKSELSWVDSIPFVLKSANNTNVIIVWVTGPKVPEVEKLPKINLLEGSMYFLEKFLGAKHNITAPDQIIHSSWCSNPNFRGTYSFETLVSAKKKQSNQEELTRPLEKNGVPVVLFAGEASNPIHFSTVHGAIETGRREADRIISIYSKKNSAGVVRLG